MVRRFESQHSRNRRRVPQVPLPQWMVAGREIACAASEPFDSRPNLLDGSAVTPLSKQTETRRQRKTGPFGDPGSLGIIGEYWNLSLTRNRERLGFSIVDLSRKPNRQRLLSRAELDC